MATFDQVNGAGTLRLIVNESSQNIATNETTVAWELRLLCSNGASYNLSPTAYNVGINGSTVASGSYTFDFRSTSNKLIASGTTVVAHNADGTKTISVSGYTAHTGTGAIGGPISVSGSMGLTTIPRATTPTVSPTSGNTASTFTISHTPASSAFYHDVAYSLDGGATYTDIVTNLIGTDTSTDWTPAHSLLPNAASATAIIRLTTRASSGGTIIGTATVNLPLAVPPSVKPTISSVSWADAQTSSPDIPTLMGGAGRFVQRWSRLIPTVTSAGASGSTVTDTDIIQNGQTTDSGVAFGAAIALSGAVPYTAYASDSRSRASDPFVSTVAVAAYNYPNLPVPTVQRTSDASGLLPAPAGTYLAITPAASVSSLIFGGSERNLLEWRIRTRPAGGSWTTVQDWTATSVSGNLWTTKYVVGGYSASLGHEVEVSIRDLFGKNGFSTAQTVVTQTVPISSESVAFDIDGDLGWGFGEYRRAGYRASFNGDIYVNGSISQGGNAVVDTTRLASSTVKGLAEFATPAEAVAGAATDLAVTPEGLALAGSAFVSRARNRNAVLNGNFRTNQRGIVSGATIAPRRYGFDMWQCAGITNLITNPSAEVNITGWSAGNVTAARSTAWAAPDGGSASFQLSSPANSDSYIQTTVTTVIGRRYTLSGTARLTAPLTGAEVIETRARTLWTFDGTTSGAATPRTVQVANVAGTQRVSVTWIAGATSTTIRAYHGQTGGTIWWDNIMLTEGDTLWPYFDGSFADCVWTGTAHASTSRRGPDTTTLTFTPAANGQQITLSSGGGIMQIISAADVKAGSNVLSWSGTATGRVYQATTAPGSLPAFAASGAATFTHDGVNPVVIEFRAVGGARTVGEVQLEAGTEVTPFEFIPTGQELALCQREFARFSALADEHHIATGTQPITTSSRFSITLPAPMRTIPTVRYSGLEVSNNNNFRTAVTAVPTVRLNPGATNLSIAASHGAVGGAAAAILLQLATNGWVEFECQR